MPGSRASGLTEFSASGATHPGRVRDHNEDAYLSRPDLGLWAVADGAGGHEAGEVAAAMIAEALGGIPTALSAEETLAQVRLRMAATHAALRTLAARKGAGAIVAATVVILLARDGHYACLWAGDSRGYRLRRGALAQITHDHSLVQELVDAGQLAAEEAEGHPRANIVTRAVGAAAETLELDKVTERLAGGDRFLLCSDGLSKELPDSEIGAILAAAPAERAAAALVEAAVASGARDNVTAVVVEVPADGHH
jgi:protein phosphatase/serine/threonine-protein phosphatase Stp1